MMGGPGSGQRLGHVPRARVELCWVLDADALARPIRAGSEGLIALRMRMGLATAELGYLIRNDGAGFVLDAWTPNTPSAAPMRFRLTLVPLPFGGARTYLHCPGLAPGQPCCRRATRLYWPVTSTLGFACRACHELAYRSSQERRRSAAEWRALVERPRPPLPSMASAWSRYRRLEAGATPAPQQRTPADRPPEADGPSGRAGRRPPREAPDLSVTPKS